MLRVRLTLTYLRDARHSGSFTLSLSGRRSLARLLACPATTVAMGEWVLPTSGSRPQASKRVSSARLAGWLGVCGSRACLLTSIEIWMKSRAAQETEPRKRLRLAERVAGGEGTRNQCNRLLHAFERF